MEDTQKTIDSLMEKSLFSTAKMFEPYRKMSNLLLSSFSTIIGNYSSVSLLGINSLVESMQKTLNACSEINNYYIDSVLGIAQKITKVFGTYKYPYLTESLSVVSKSMSSMLGGLALEQINHLCKIDYSALFTDILPQSSSIAQIVDNAYSKVYDELSSDDKTTDNFTEEEIEEVLLEQSTNPKGFQERIANWTEKKKIQFFIIWQLVYFIYGNFLQPYFQEYVGVPVTAYIVSNVKELPQKGANIIGQLKEDVEAIIIEDTNYYYKVSFVDENGKTMEGYVAKRNLKKINKKEKEEDIKQEK